MAVSFFIELALASALSWLFFVWQSYNLDVLYDANDLVYRQSDVGKNLFVREDVRRWAQDARRSSSKLKASPVCTELSHVFLFDEPTYVRFLAENGVLLERRALTRDERLLASSFRLRETVSACVVPASAHFDYVTQNGTNEETFLEEISFSYAFAIDAETGHIYIDVSRGVDPVTGHGGVKWRFALSDNLLASPSTPTAGYTADFFADVRRITSSDISEDASSVVGGPDGGKITVRNPCHSTAINAATRYRWGYFTCTYGQYCVYHLANLRRPRNVAESDSVLPEFYWSCQPDLNESLSSVKNVYGAGESVPLDIPVPSLRTCPTGKLFDGYYCASASSTFS